MAYTHAYVHPPFFNAARFFGWALALATLWLVLSPLLPPELRVLLFNLLALAVIRLRRLPWGTAALYHLTLIGVATTLLPPISL